MYTYRINKKTIRRAAARPVEKRLTVFSLVLALVMLSSFMAGCSLPFSKRVSPASTSPAISTRKQGAQARRRQESKPATVSEPREGGAALHRPRASEIKAPVLPTTPSTTPTTSETTAPTTAATTPPLATQAPTTAPTAAPTAAPTTAPTAASGWNENDVYSLAAIMENIAASQPTSRILLYQYLAGNFDESLIDTALQYSQINWYQEAAEIAMVLAAEGMDAESIYMTLVMMHGFTEQEAYTALGG